MKTQSSETLFNEVLIYDILIVDVYNHYILLLDKINSTIFDTSNVILTYN